jgi:hypothetical protein
MRAAGIAEELTARFAEAKGVEMQRAIPQRAAERQALHLDGVGDFGGGD